MTTTINASTSSGLVNTADTSGILQLQTASTAAVTITAAQNVGVGTASPSTILQVSSATPVVTVTGTGTTASSQDFTTNGAAQRASIGVERSTGGGLFVGSSAYAAVFGSAGASSTQFASNNNVRMTIDSAGLVGIGATPITKLDVTVGDGGANSNAFFVRGTTGVFGLYPYLDASLGCLINSYNSAISAYKPMSFQASSFAWLPNGTEKMRIDSNGIVLINTTAQYFNEKLRIKASNDTRAIGFQSDSSNEAGYIYINAGGTSVTYATSSDYRLKEDIVPMTGALNRVAQLKPVTYKWKESGIDSQGFIAHELQAVVPDCVTGEKDAVDEEGNPRYQGIDTSFLVATLTAAIQELKAINDTQAETINALTARIVALEGK
jgi:hypothetical protein